MQHGFTEDNSSLSNLLALFNEKSDRFTLPEKSVFFLSGVQYSIDVIPCEKL